MIVQLWSFNFFTHSFTLILTHQMVIALLALMWFHSLLMLTLFSIYLSLILTPILSYHQDTLPVLLDYLLRFSLTSDSYIAHNSLQLFELSFTQLLLIQPSCRYCIVHLEVLNIKCLCPYFKVGERYLGAALGKVGTIIHEHTSY